MEVSGKFFGGALIVGALAVVAAGGVADAQSLGDTSGTGAASISAATGEQTYREICQACHMANAEGGTGAGIVPALAANAHLADRGFMLDRVVRGKGGMPAFAEMLSPEQIVGVIGYVRTHFGNAYADEVTVDDVRKLVAGASGE